MAMTMLVAEAADELGVSKPRVHQLIAEGRLRFKRRAPRLLMLDPAQVKRMARKDRPNGRPKKKL